jgi:hypothetical protein
MSRKPILHPVYEYKTISKILEKLDRIDIGRKLSIIERSPFFKTGIILDIFHKEGNLDCRREALKIVNSG